jgi:hypothetical protein
MIEEKVLLYLQKGDIDANIIIQRLEDLGYTKNNIIFTLAEMISANTIKFVDTKICKP